MFPAPAAGHASDAPGAPGLASAWTLDLWLLAPLALAMLIYVIGLARYWGRAGVGRGVRYRHAVAWIAGMMALFLALVWPLDALGEWSLAAHMAQHMLLIAVAAPLVLLGLPGVVWLAALPRNAARAVARAGRKLTIPAVATSTTLAMLVQAGIMWGWHLPAAMELALVSDPLHYAMHASFFGAGLLFWWTLLHSVRERYRGFGAGAIALLGTMAQMGLLSALLTFAPEARYPFYFGRSAEMGLTPLEDQQLAGLIMWVPGAVPYLLGGVILMALWLRRLEHQDLRRADS